MSRDLRLTIKARHTVKMQRDPGYRVLFGQHGHSLMLSHVPDWMGATDIIERRGDRTFAVSQTSTIPRWRHWLRKLFK